MRPRKLDDPPRRVPVWTRAALPVTTISNGRLGLDGLQQLLDETPALDGVQGVVPARRKRLKHPREGVTWRELRLTGEAEQVAVQSADNRRIRELAASLQVEDFAQPLRRFAQSATLHPPVHRRQGRPARCELRGQAPAASC